LLPGIFLPPSNRRNFFRNQTRELVFPT